MVQGPPPTSAAVLDSERMSDEFLDGPAWEKAEEEEPSGSFERARDAYERDGAANHF